MNFKNVFCVLIAVLLIYPLCNVAAETPKEKKRVILSVIPQDSSGEVVNFDIDSLESLGLISIQTETPWTKGTVHFEGVLVRDMLESVGVTDEQATAVMASALDDYSIEIPLKDFLENDVILATRKNGKPMRVRDNGPVWIIYPWSDHSELRRPHFYARSIWQLKSLKIQ